MLSYTELKPGIMVVIDGQPYEVLEASFLRMQQRKAVVQAKFKNLINGKVISRNIHASDKFEEADVNKKSVKYLYSHRGQYWFSDINNPANRFFLTEEVLGFSAQFLKPNSEATAIEFNDQIINVKPPIKVDLKVQETPPGDKGDTATGGKKLAVLETRAKVIVPLFINNGDVVRVNTETGEYVERTEKSLK